MDTERSVSRHYEHGSLESAILAALTAAGKDTGKLTHADLAAIDEFHIGGRQATMLAAEDPSVADALVLFSYPLHPPDKPLKPRTEHLPHLRTPALFVHGTKDPFGSIAEMEDALRLIPARTQLHVVDRAGHDLARGKFDVTTLPTYLLALSGSASVM